MRGRMSFVIKKRNTDGINKTYPIIDLPLYSHKNKSVGPEEQDVDEGYECEICKYNLHSHSFVNIKETDGVVYYHTIVSEIMKHRQHEIDEYLDHVCGELMHQKNPWIWITDFTGFSTIDMMRNKILMRLIDLIHDNYGVNMQQIIILHSSWNVRWGYTFLKKNIAGHIQEKIVFDRKDMFNQMVNIVMKVNNHF